MLIHFQLDPASAPGEAVKDGLSGWTTTTHAWENLGGIQGSWIQPSIVLAIAVSERVNQQMEDIFICISPSQSITLSLYLQKKKKTKNSRSLLLSL